MNPDESILRSLAARLGAAPADGGAAVWAWANLDKTERETCARAIDRFAAMFNDTFADTREETIPACWRRHAPLAQELLVQFWAWYAHLDPGGSILTALEYHDRHLPAFQTRLRTRLLGAMASECRKGAHRDVARRNQEDRVSSGSRAELVRLFGHPDPQ